MCKVNVSPEVMTGHDAALEIADSIYPFVRTDIRTLNIAEGNFGMNIEDIWQGEVPTRLLVVLVKSQAYNGDYHFNPYHFFIRYRFLCKWRGYTSSCLQIRS